MTRYDSATLYFRRGTPEHPAAQVEEGKKKISFSEDGFPFIRKRKTTVVRSELVPFLLQKHSTGCLSSVQLALEVDDKLSLLLKKATRHLKQPHLTSRSCQSPSVTVSLFPLPVLLHSRLPCSRTAITAGDL